MAKKTRWFPCSIKPVRNGWYEVMFDKTPVGLFLFSGGRWRKDDEGDSATGDNRPGFFSKDKWRGLTK